jgi:glyoxylase-like metal-dependent hydrolase (beta-lactamase superfamily II)
MTSAMKRPPFQTGLARLSDKVHAYLQPDGGLGLSNAGLVGSARDALLVDTLFDLAHTRRMLDEIAREVTSDIGRVVNTHHNGDHCWGNQLVRGAEIIGHRRCAELMRALPPETLQRIKQAPDTLPGARAMREGLERFDFAGIEITPPTTFVPDDGMRLEVDGLVVELIYVGPAHTAGDVIVHLPEEGVTFTGDVVFRLCAPIGWEGTYARWIGALEQIMALPGDTLVPGHGPVCGKEGAREMRDYLVYVRDESRRHFEAGRTVGEAAARIDLGPYAGWLESERIVFNVDRAYRELRGEPYDTAVDFVRLMATAAELRERHRAHASSSG